MERKKPDPSRAIHFWDQATTALAMVAARRLVNQAELSEIRSEEMRLQLDLARMAADTVDMGYDHCNEWFVWWYNNGETSTRGDGACVDRVEDIPRNRYPK